MKTINLALVEDNPADLVYLLREFESCEWVHVTQCFREGTEFIKSVDAGELIADVVIMDYKMPRLSGLQTLRMISAQGMGFRILMVSHGFYQNLFGEMQAMGQRYYCRKIASRILDAIPAMLSNRNIYSDLAEIHEWDSQTRIAQLSSKDALEWQIQLSPLNKKLIYRICCGKTSAEIGEELGYEHSSIEKYRGLLLKFLNLRNSQQLVSWAFSKGLVPYSLVNGHDWARRMGEDGAA